MTRKEFSSKSEAMSKVGRWYGLGVLCAIFGLMLVEGLLSDFIKRHFQIGWSDNASGILFLVTMVAGTIGIAFLERRVARKQGLACSSCGSHFINNASRWKLLLTGNCPKCGHKLIEEVPPTNLPSEFKISREEFLMKIDAFARKSKRRLIRLFIFLFIAVACFIPVVGFFRNYVDRGGLDWVTLTELRWFAGIILAVVTLSFISFFILVATGNFKIRCLPCPECGRSLVGTGKIALKTGICIYCGCRLFEAAASVKA
jgi:DNA-directed RNA polymerase subunit RPC12/RpoP